MKRVCSLSALVMGAALAVPAQSQDVVPPPGTAPAKASPTKAAPEKPVAGKEAPAKSTTDKKLKPLTVVIGLATGTKLEGTLIEATEIPMRTSFGQVMLPLSEISGIKVAKEGIATTTVELHNGDSITGAIDLDKLILQTEWGRAEVNPANVASLIFAPGLKWISENGLAGTRWRLTEEKPAASSTTATSGASRTAPTTTGTTSRPTFTQPGTTFFPQ